MNDPEIPEDRIESGLNVLLGLLDQFNVKATFFVLGRVADHYPHIIKKIADKKHDIGTHGYNHELLYDQTPETFEKDLLRSLESIEKACGLKVTKYRAPSYSITMESKWALDILVKHGIKIDSSIMPSVNSRFGIRNMPARPYKITFDDDRYLLEVPPTIIRLPGKKLPISSGIAFRFFPLVLIRFAFRKYHQKNLIPMVIVHTWEFDVGQPVLEVGRKGKFIHYHGISNTFSNLSEIISSYHILTLQDADPLVVTKSIHYKSIGLNND
jgi:polysaccharide deacetylase family protein (PEP-CTERM system associated)